MAKARQPKKGSTTSGRGGITTTRGTSGGGFVNPKMSTYLDLDGASSNSPIIAGGYPIDFGIGNARAIGNTKPGGMSIGGKGGGKRKKRRY